MADKDKFKVTKRTSLPIRDLKDPDNQFVPHSNIDYIGQRRQLERVAYAINNKLPVLLIGETGTGKTALVRYLAAMTNNNFRRVNHNGGTTVEDLVGKILVSNTRGGTFWVDGVLIDAMRKGHWYLADEINAASAEINFVYHSLLDDDGFVVLVENDGEVVHPHENFRFFAAMNPATTYSGTKELNKALMSRFFVMKVDFPSIKDEEQILIKSGQDSKVAQAMVKFAVSVRGLHSKNEIEYVLSTRDLIMWSNAHKYFKMFIVSAEAAILNKVNEDDFNVVKDLLGTHFKSVDDKVSDRKGAAKDDDI